MVNALAKAGWEDLPEAEAALAPTRKRLAELRMAVASPSGYDRRRFRPFRGRRRGAGAFYRPRFFCIPGPEYKKRVKFMVHVLVPSMHRLANVDYDGSP